MWRIGDFVGTLQQIRTTVVGEMWGLRFMMPQLSGKMWDSNFASSKAREDWEQVVFSLDR